MLIAAHLLSQSGGARKKREPPSALVNLCITHGMDLTFREDRASICKAIEFRCFLLSCTYPELQGKPDIKYLRFRLAHEQMLSAARLTGAPRNAFLSYSKLESHTDIAINLRITRALCMQCTAVVGVAPMRSRDAYNDSMAPSSLRVLSIFAISYDVPIFFTMISAQDKAIID